MTNIRRLSKERIISLAKASGRKIQLKQLAHMLTGEGNIDINKAKNWLEAAAAERITVNPMHQSIGENRQLCQLSSAFHGVEKHRRDQVFLDGGKRVLSENVSWGIRTDIDAEIIEERCDVLLTLKTTQSNAYKGGGSQGNSFDHLIDLISQAPSRQATGKLWLGVYVSGGFWFEPRNGYRTYSDKATTCFKILREHAKGKKCIVFTDDNLPKRRTTFYSHFLRRLS